MAISDEMENPIEIRDEDVDTDAIFRTIRENIGRRREFAESEGVDFDRIVAGSYASKVGSRFDIDLYHGLHRMNAGYDNMGVDLYLTDSTVPLVGGLIQRLRSALHRLVIYYVNMHAGKQIRFNEHVSRALESVVREVEDSPQQSDVDALKEELAALRVRLDALESRDSG